jgi:hypothetical protein
MSNGAEGLENLTQPVVDMVVAAVIDTGDVVKSQVAVPGLDCAAAHGQHGEQGIPELWS